MKNRKLSAATVAVINEIAESGTPDRFGSVSESDAIATVARENGDDIGYAIAVGHIRFFESEYGPADDSDRDNIVADFAAYGYSAADADRYFESIRGPADAADYRARVHNFVVE